MDTDDERAGAQPVLRASALIKSYGDVTALDGIDICVERGEVVGLVGPNGAGKTTLIETLVGLRQPTSGSVEVLGRDPRADREQVLARVAVQPQHVSLFPLLTVTETIDLWASLYTDPLPTDEVVERVRLESRRDARAAGLSGGESRRLLLALAIVPNVDVLVLDEPGAGLDPTARRHLWDIIREQRDDGRSILLCTHQMDAVAALCDRVAILDRGVLVADDTPDALVREHCPQGEVRLSTDTAPDDAALAALPGARDVSVSRGPGRHEVRIATDDSDELLAELLAGTHVSSPRDIEIHTSTLDDVFVALTGGAIDEDGERRAGERDGRTAR